GSRTLVRHDVQRRRALDDLHELVAVRVALPRRGAGKLGAVDVAVAERSERGETAAPLPVDLGHLRGTAVEQLQLGELGLEIQDRDHVGLPSVCAAPASGAPFSIVRAVTGTGRWSACMTKQPRSALRTTLATRSCGS